MKFILLAGLLFSFAVRANSGFVTVSEFEVEYEIAGSGEYTVLLEAGGGSGMSDWEPVFGLIAEQARVVRYSRVGDGNSTAIERHFTSREYAEHASELLNKLDIQEPVILLAHSYGGSVARDFAAAHPDKVKALFMLDPSSEHDVDIMRAIDLERANREIAEIKLSDMENGMSNEYLDFWTKRPLPRFPEIQDMPVTVIASIQKIDNPPNLFWTDEARTMWGDVWLNWAQAFPQGRGVLTEQSGHFIQFDEPELVISELSLLIQRLNTNNL